MNIKTIYVDAAMAGRAEAEAVCRWFDAPVQPVRSAEEVYAAVATLACINWTGVAVRCGCIPIT